MDKFTLWRRWYHYKSRFGNEYNGVNEKSVRVGLICGIITDQVRESVHWCQQGVRAVWKIRVPSSPITRAKSSLLCDSEFVDWVALLCDARVQWRVFDRIRGVGCFAVRRESTTESGCGVANRRAKELLRPGA